MRSILCTSILAKRPKPSEGGFAPEEVEFLIAAGFRPLRLAGAILRAETAALYAVAAVQVILSERSSWIPKPP